METRAPGLSAEAVDAAISRLTDQCGAEQAARIRRGVPQAAALWFAEDGDGAAFADFCAAQFIASAEGLAAAFARLARVLEEMEGRLHEIRRELIFPIEVDTGELSPFDLLIADLDLAAHVNEDLFRTKVAFVALLNFPLCSLAERLAEGAGWDRETWARSRLMDAFRRRIPAVVHQEVTRVSLEVERYISGYNIRLDRLVASAGGAGETLFPEGLSLISHWGLRDELASHYADPSPEGLVRQRLIARVMERIVRQEIPAAAIDNPNVLWDVERNTVRAYRDDTLPPVYGGTEGGLASPSAEREPDTRYAPRLAMFHAVRRIDPFCPTEPTFLLRRFEDERQIPEAEVEALLVSVLAAPEVRDLGRLIAARLGRPLEPFDLWYSGFKPRAGYSDETLDAVVRERFPDLATFARDLPMVLAELGFTGEKAQWLAERIAVDPARGAGHAMPAVRRADRAHLRTRVPRGGMDYKGWNVAMHELGHSVEQVFSLYGIDHWPLAGVPNNACTEAFAFVFQNRDLEVLGLNDAGTAGAEARRDAVLATLWNTWEIAGVSLVDMRVWRWLYAHPDATPAALRDAVLDVAREVWNRWFAPVFGVRDSVLLAVYSHMIAYGLYLPDYTIGHLIAFQIAEHLAQGDFAAEVERIARQGYLTPDIWMRGAVGGPVSAGALLGAARQALASVH
jgi:hypothetical protein